MLPSPTDLENYLEVCKTLNISRTAERIGVSQPALTQSIQKLETAVGAQLLIRTKTGVQLTRAGQRVLSQVSTLSSAWKALRKEAQLDQSELRGKFRVGAHPSVARYALPGFLKTLAREAPLIELELAHDLSRRITEDVLRFRVDLGFVINPVAHPDLVLKKLGDDVVAVFKARRGQYAQTLFGDPELAQTQFILKKLHRATFGFTQFVPCPNLEVVQTLVASGAGYGILPTRVAECNPGAELAVVDAKLPVFKDEIFLAYRQELRVSAAGKALARIAAQALV